MASAIDDTKPVTGTPTTQSVRDNFATAKTEITALQAAVPTWTVGSVPFAVSTTALGQDNANLFWNDANDRLGIGTSSPTQKLVVATAATTSPVGALFSNGTESFLVGVEGSTTGASASGSIPYAAILNDASGHGMQFATGNTVRQTVALDGGVYIGSPTGLSKSAGTLNAVTVYGNNVVLTSDADLKAEIEPLTLALPIVAAIEPKSFKWLPLPEEIGMDGEVIERVPPGFADKLNRGFLAQDVLAVLGGKVEDGVDLGAMVAVLWQAVRELSDRVIELEGDKPA